MKVKYYYSSALQRVTLQAFADGNGVVVHIPDQKPKFVEDFIRFTICTILEDNKLSIGYAVCSKKDHFVKKVGRNIAFARALNKPYAVIDISNRNIHEATDEIIDKIIYGKQDVSDSL